MQAFGKFATEFDLEYLVEHYIYFNAPDEAITAEDLSRLLKKKNKTVAGTIFLYNPVMAPVGYNTDRPLAEQGYAFDGNYTELQFERLLDIFQSRNLPERPGKRRSRVGSTRAAVLPVPVRVMPIRS